MRIEFLQRRFDPAGPALPDCLTRHPKLLANLLERLVLLLLEEDPEIYVVEPNFTQAIYVLRRKREIRQAPFRMPGSAWSASSFDAANLVPQALLAWP